MKVLSKIALSCCTFALLSLPAFSFDWGGKVTADTSFKGTNNEELKFKELDTANLWLSLPLSKDNSKYFTAEGLYQFKFDDSTASDKVINTLDLNLFKFVANIKLQKARSISINAGRFGISDLTGLIFAQNCDGLFLQYSSPSLHANLYGGYTGLLNANMVTILNNPEGTSYSLGENAIYRLAPKYIPFGFNISLPALFANQNLSLQGWGFMDANGDDYNRWYGILGLDGFVASNISYSVKSAFESVNFESFANLSLLNLYCYFTDSFFMNIGGTYASGKSGDISAFTGFTSSTALLSADDPEYSSLVKADLGFTKTFGQSVYLNAGAGLAFSLEEENEGYKGIQFEAGAMYKVFNDLQLGASFGQFIGKETENNKTQLAVKAVVVF